MSWRSLRQSCSKWRQFSTRLTWTPLLWITITPWILFYLNVEKTYHSFWLVKAFPFCCYFRSVIAHSHHVLWEHFALSVSWKGAVLSIGLHSCCYASYKRGMKRSCQSCSFVESVQVGQPCIFSASSIMHSSVYYLFVPRYTRDLFTALTRHLGSSITCFYPSFYKEKISFY